MQLSDHLRNAGLSAARVFAAGVALLWIKNGAPAPSHLSLNELRDLLDAGAVALGLTAANALRKGETKFGLGAIDPPAVYDDAAAAKHLQGTE